MTKGQKQSGGGIQEMEGEGAGEEEVGWGGHESSPGYQPWWAGLLWGWQCDTYAETHRHRDASRHAAYMSPPAVEAGGRQYRDATGTCSSHTA